MRESLNCAYCGGNAFKIFKSIFDRQYQCCICQCIQKKKLFKKELINDSLKKCKYCKWFDAYYWGCCKSVDGKFVSPRTSFDLVKATLFHFNEKEDCKHYHRKWYLFWRQK